MSFKIITIKKEVYGKLVKLKKKNESFSELFKRLIRRKRREMKDFAGGWSNLSKKELKVILKGTTTYRKFVERSFEERLKVILK